MGRDRGRPAPAARGDAACRGGARPAARAAARARRSSALVAIPALIIFAVFPELLLRIAFGADFTDAADALLLLGAAMTLLAVAYLTVQYMVALGEVRFLWVLGLVAIAEPFLLTAGDEGIVGVRRDRLRVQCAAAAAVLVLGLRRAAAAHRLRRPASSVRFARGAGRRRAASRAG